MDWSLDCVGGPFSLSLLPFRSRKLPYLPPDLTQSASSGFVPSYQLCVYSTEPNTSLLISDFPSMTLSPPRIISIWEPESTFFFSAQPESCWCFVRREKLMLIKTNVMRRVPSTFTRQVFLVFKKKSDCDLRLTTVVYPVLISDCFTGNPPVDTLHFSQSLAETAVLFQGIYLSYPFCCYIIKSSTSYCTVSPRCACVSPLSLNLTWGAGLWICLLFLSAVKCRTMSCHIWACEAIIRAPPRTPWAWRSVMYLPPFAP